MDFHKGIDVLKMNKKNRQFKWPDPRAQVYFKKTISTSWSQRLQKEIFDERRARFVFKDFTDLRGYGGVYIYIYILIYCRNYQ